ncbi:hypothetical protein G6O67_005602 [Ophiocordyceps sinensis]|uniref:Uncharacterized protein n=2 Tax=Ophiocordyceps sinensis TaxID=72228 RepID=A0A8H4PLG8_9HYPO|nr:hypothetical protein OCS_04530 [Ophiocordyceps sinensis CO18]KAF4506917.1 hypothetical protein G6O67_005602 [Ophiocordyceps sinensis]
METPERSASQVTDDVDRLSLYQRARRYPRSRIIVEPLLWTKLQLDLLQCTFTGPHPAPPVIMELDNPAHEDIYKDFAWSFSRPRPRDRPDAMRAIFCSFGGLLRPLNDLYFAFGSRDLLLSCLAFVVRREISSGPVAAAYIDHRQLVRLRARKKTYEYAGRQRHTLGLCLGNETNEQFQEPYIVALLIAVAQSQWWFIVKSGLESQASSIKPMVFFSTDDKESLYLYSATVSSAFISMFDNPRVPPTAPQPLHIQITKIPCKPFETLRNRMYALVFSATTPDGVSIYGRGDV